MTQPSSPAGQDTPAAAERPDYAALLQQIPDDYLAQDRRVNSRVGNIAQRLAAQDSERREREAQEHAKAEAEARLHKLAEENPFEFSQVYLKEHAASQAHREIEKLRSAEQDSLMNAVGQAYGALPEWREIMSDPDSAQRLAEAVAGRQGGDIVASFNAVALDLVAERRAQHAPNNEKINAEVEARVQERLAARLRGEAVPQMSAARTMSNSIDPRSMSEADFNRWYKQTFGV